MKRIYSAQNTLMVDHLKHVLDGEGIFCVVRNRYLSSAAGRLPPNECWTELWVVEDDDYARAQTVLERARGGTGADGKNWVCARCGESLEAQFEACWKCCTARDAQDVADDSTEDGSLPRDLARAPERPLQAWWLIWGVMLLIAVYILHSYSRSGW